MNADVVLSPYSTYLVLPFQPHAALKNLNALKKLGTFGRFGHYEAVDFTPKRIGDSPYEMIKSYMAHHIGMSILAVNNAVNGGILQKRFLADREMRSAKELLQEKITNGTELFQEQYTCLLYTSIWILLRSSFVMTKRLREYGAFQCTPTRRGLHTRTRWYAGLPTWSLLQTIFVFFGTTPIACIIWPMILSLIHI